MARTDRQGNRVWVWVVALKFFDMGFRYRTRRGAPFVSITFSYFTHGFPNAIALPVLTISLATPFALTGMMHGVAPNSFTTIATKALKGFVIGFVLGGLIALALSVAVGWLFSSSQREGAYAMSVVLVLFPLGGLLLGIGFAIRTALR